MTTNLIEGLAAGEPRVWCEVFERLYPVAYQSAQLRLGEILPSDGEDVAIETLREILEEGPDAHSEEELKPLAAAIARNKATDRLRRHFAEKRGGKSTQSLDALMEADFLEPIAPTQVDVLDNLTVRELRDLLGELCREVRKEYRIVLRDYYFDQLSYLQIAEKRKISLGSVGVYIQRGLAALRNVLSKRPKLRDEFLQLIGDKAAVTLLLPLISAVQLGGWFFQVQVRASMMYRNSGQEPKSPDGPSDDHGLFLSDDVRLLIAYIETLPQCAPLGEIRKADLIVRLNAKFPQRSK